MKFFKGLLKFFGILTIVGLIILSAMALIANFAKKETNNT
jgi:hypothetical protein